MVSKAVVLIHLFIAAVQGCLIPEKPVKTISVQNTRLLTGSSGTLSYPTTGNYFVYDNLLAIIQINEQSVFTVERTDLQLGNDSIVVYNKENLVLSQVLELSGTTNIPAHFLVNSDVIVDFSSDGSVQQTGFTVSWAPIASVTAEITAAAQQRSLIANSPVNTMARQDTRLLSGSIGIFTSGPYSSYDNILAILPINQQSVFTIESVDLESGFDAIAVYSKGNSALEQVPEFTGSSTTALHYLVNSDVIVDFSSDGSVELSGYSFSWAPIASVTDVGNLIQ